MSSEQRQQLISDLLQAVKENSDADNAAEAAEFALLRVKLAQAQARLEKPAATRSAGQESFGLRQLLGLNVVSVWTLIAIATIAIAVHGRCNNYFDPIEKLYETATQRCIVSGEDFVMEMARPPVDCGVCRDLREMPVEHNMTKELFLQRYAYTNRPVLIKNAITNWTALTHFSPEFFRDLYDSVPGAYKVQNDAGQFFAYKTEFNTLKEALHINEERRKKPWYFGWSNADEKVGQELRKHYSRPFFIPDDAESSKIDWMFMGISAKGAQLHIDYVNRPSWQAQIKGRKVWEMVPSPECMSVCHTFNVTVHPGDIINLDTTRWYHATFVYPGDLSITIGSEYD